MNKFFGPMVTIAVLALLILVLQGIARRHALRPYWDRACMGMRWRRCFPDAPKTEIREFLSILVDAFGFRHSRRCCFAPDDKLMDIYRAVYPQGSLSDSMELESFAYALDNRYGIDLFASWQDGITLGEIYAEIRKRAG